MNDDTNDGHTTHDSAISRRNVLILGGVAIVAAALPASFRLLERETGDLADELLAMLADPAGAAVIGRQLSSTVAPEKQKAVAAKIAKRLRTHGWQPGDTPEEMRAALAARIRHDFEHGEMVEVAGWQMSRTGAELCALAATRHEADHAAPLAHG
ncbi:MAG: hypothetical protein K8R18_05500 [Parvibaculum sp.]|jgi:hypothetical protein|uniref:hypothetical protein n=1 Tax=Parvibaculum sp. TaxID=2024848 RepID=UPI0025EB2E0B|nr:hypothetical protein [Parvibaculum sp.]MCE9649066.1 hypothetical protein [Parvibaculum sp.]